MRVSFFQAHRGDDDFGTGRHFADFRGEHRLFRGVRFGSPLRDHRVLLPAMTTTTDFLLAFVNATHERNTPVTNGFDFGFRKRERIRPL